MIINRCVVCGGFAQDELEGRWYCNRHYAEARERLRAEVPHDEDLLHDYRRLADGTQEFDLDNPPPEIFAGWCEGYGDKRGKCPHEGTEQVLEGAQEKPEMHLYCRLCYEHYESDRSNWEAQQWEDGQ